MEHTTKLMILALTCLVALASGCASAPRISGSTLQALSRQEGEHALPGTHAHDDADVALVSGRHVRFEAGMARVGHALATGVGQLVITDDYGPRQATTLRLTDIDHIELHEQARPNNDVMTVLAVLGAIVVIGGLLVGAGMVAVGNSLHLGSGSFGSGSGI